MVYVQKIPDWEVKMRREYLEALKETTNKKTREQIVEIKKKRRDLKTLIKDEDKKRLDFISKEPISYRLFKVLSNVVDEKPISIMCPFTDEEIYTAKKCLVNKIVKPPNYYDFYDEKKDEKQGISQASAAGSVSNQQTAVAYSLTAKIENSIAAAMRPLTDFSKLPSSKEPADKGKRGNWMLDSDFSSCFDFIQVYFNPTVYQHLSSEYYPCDRERANNARPEHEVIVLEEIKQEESTGDLLPSQKTVSDIGDEASTKPKQLELLACFNPSSYQKPDKMKPYCILEKFDFDNLTCVSAFNTLSGAVDSIKISKPNENSVFRFSTYCPTSFALTLAANSKFRLMSIPQYLSSPSLTQSTTRGGPSTRSPSSTSLSRSSDTRSSLNSKSKAALRAKT